MLRIRGLFCIDRVGEMVCLVRKHVWTYETRLLVLETNNSDHQTGLKPSCKSETNSVRQ